MVDTSITNPKEIEREMIKTTLEIVNTREEAIKVALEIKFKAPPPMTLTSQLPTKRSRDPRLRTTIMPRLPPPIPTSITTLAMLLMTRVSMNS